MSDSFLSQDDVDSLFGNQIGEDIKDTAKPAVAEPQDGIRPYNLAQQERFIRGRMPTLEMIHERFSTQLRIGLASYLGKSVEVSVEQVKFIKYNEFLRNLVVPTSLNLVQIQPFTGTALIVIEPAMMFNIVDHLFGGNGRIHTRVEGREFTETEKRIIQRVLEIIYAKYESSWEPVHPIKFEYVRSEMNTKFANITSPNEIVVSTAFNIDLGTGSGQVHVCLPYPLIEPVRDLLMASMQDEAPKADEQWTRTLHRKITSTEVDVRADIGFCSLKLKDIMNLKPGDIIPITVPPTVQAKVDDIPVWECSYGLTNGKYAIKIEEILTPPDDSIAGPTTIDMPQATYTREQQAPA